MQPLDTIYNSVKFINGMQLNANNSKTTNNQIGSLFLLKTVVTRLSCYHVVQLTGATHTDRTKNNNPHVFKFTIFLFMCVVFFFFH